MWKPKTSISAIWTLILLRSHTVLSFFIVNLKIKATNIICKKWCWKQEKQKLRTYCNWNRWFLVRGLNGHKILQGKWTSRIIYVSAIWVDRKKTTVIFTSNGRIIQYNYILITSHWNNKFIDKLTAGDKRYLSDPILSFCYLIFQWILLWKINFIILLVQYLNTFEHSIRMLF